MRWELGSPRVGTASQARFMTSPRQVGGCLPEDAVVALVWGRLARDELAVAELHLDGCAACRELVAHALHAAALAPALHAVPPAPAPQARADAWCIGRYRVLREVGAGSMGRVYAALDPGARRSAAAAALCARLARLRGESPRTRPPSRRRGLSRGDGQALRWPPLRRDAVASARGARRVRPVRW